MSQVKSTNEKSIKYTKKGFKNMMPLFSTEDIIRTLIKTGTDISAGEFAAELLDISTDKLYETIDEYEEAPERTENNA